MHNVHICGVWELSKMISHIDPDLVISISDPKDVSFQGETLQKSLEKANCPILELQFHDIDRTAHGFVSPSTEDGQKIISALDEHMPGPDGTLLVHCAAGVSRSPAAAMLAIAHLLERDGSHPQGVARKAFDTVLEAAPHAYPNRRLAYIADKLIPACNNELGELVEELREEINSSPIPTKIW